MTRILMIRLSGFYTQNLPEAPSAGMFRIVHDRGKVLDSCDAAMQKGVVPGTSLSEAKAVLREGCTYTEYVESEFRQARDEWLEHLLDYADGLEASMSHEACIDLSGHPDPVGTASQLLLGLATKCPHYRLCASIAPAKWIAKVVCSPVDKAALALGLPVLEPVDDVLAFIEDIPTSLLTPVPEGHRERLAFLGYRWARTVPTASMAVLKEQFGRDAFLIYECVRGRVLDTVCPNFPGQTLSAKVAFDDPLDSDVLVEDALSNLCTELATKLCSTDRTAEAIRIVFEQEAKPAVSIRRTFPKPVQTATSLRVAASALWRRSTLESPPVAIRILLSGLAKSPRGQKSFIGLESVQERTRSCDVAVRCLQAAFGEDVVQTATDITVPRRLRLLRAWKRATGWS